MKLAISEDKINTEAAALEICRNQIIIDLEKLFRIREKPKNFHVLMNELERYLLNDHYEHFRKRIVSNMDTFEQNQIPDYKVEMYIRNFIIQPIMDDNYQRLLGTLKKIIIEKFIDKFPISTTVLEPTVVDRLNLKNQERKPLDALYGVVQTFLPVLDLAENFEALVRAIEREINFFKDMSTSTPANQEFLKRQVSDSNNLVKMLEYNCWILLDLCCRVLDSAITNYRIDLLLTKDEMDKLKVDFKDFCRQRIIKDGRSLGKMSPNSLYSTVNGYCKDVWKRIKAKIANDLAYREKNKVIMPFSERAMFKHSFYKHFKDDVEMTLMTKLKIVPREDVFLYQNYTNVSRNIDTMIDNCFNQMVLAMKEATDKPEKQVQELIEEMYRQTTKFKCKQFQLNSKFNTEEILSLVNRRWIVIGALASTPKTLFPHEYADHLSHIARIANDLEVMNDNEVKQMFSMVGSLQSRKTYREQIEQQKKRCEQVFSHNASLKLPEIIYLVVGLYFLVTDADKDLEEMKRAFNNADLIRFSPPSYKRRRLLFQIVRYLKNGHFFILNYSVVHMVEMNLERQRFAHNRYIQTMVLKKNIQDQYVIDYNDLARVYKEMPIKDLAKLVEGSAHGFKDPQRAKRDALFKSAFIADTQFDSNIVLGKDNVPMMAVDKGLTIEKVSPSPTRVKQPGLDESFFLNSSTFEMDEGPHLTPGASRLTEEEEEELRFHGKLQYLQENIRTYEFISLQKEKSGHSRFPIMVLSGFMSENSNKFDDWKQMTELYPYTEMITINWEALTPSQIFSNLMTSVKKVSVGSIANLLAGQLHNILNSKEEASKLSESDTQERMDANPFEKANNEEEDSNAGVLKESTEPEENPGIFGLFKKAKMKDIFNVDNLTLVIPNKSGCPQLDQNLIKPPRRCLQEC